MAKIDLTEEQDQRFKGLLSGLKLNGVTPFRANQIATALATNRPLSEAGQETLIDALMHCHPDAETD